MKTCPHCKHELGFGTFVLRYGSDTLLKHSPQAHHHEHDCESCHARLWLHYDPKLFRQSFRQNVLWAAVIAGFCAVAFAKPFFAFDSAQTLLFTVMLLFFAVPMSIIVSKYQSAVLKEEK